MLDKTDITINLDYLTFTFNLLDDFLKEHTKNIFWLSPNSDTMTFKYNNINIICKLTYLDKHWYYKMFDFLYIEKNWHLIVLFQLYIWAKKGVITTRDKIEIKGSFMQYFGNEFVYKVLYHFFNIKTINITRLDIALDIPETKKNIINSFINNPKTSLNYDKELLESETYYFWYNRDKKKYLIRVYNKILDSFKKNKTYLYNFTSENLTRVELELLENDIIWLNNINTKLINLESVFFDLKLLKDLFFLYSSKHISYFNNIDFQKYTIKYNQPTRTIITNNLDLNQLPKWWQKNAPSIIKKLKNIIWFKTLLELLNFNDDDLKTLHNHIFNKTKLQIAKKNTKFTKKLNDINKDTYYYTLINNINNNAVKTFDLLYNNNVSVSFDFNLYIEKALNDFYKFNLDLNND